MIGRLVSRASDGLTEYMWIRMGRPVPPPSSVKRRMLSSLITAFGAELFIETGTYLGDTVEALKDRVRVVHSIELGDDLFYKAKQRFAGCPKVRLWHGDSGDVLPAVLGSVDARCLFWLDGHYSAGATARGVEDTPVLRELGHIFAASLPPWLIAIDDARLFNGTGGYPCLASLEAHVAQQNPDFQLIYGLDAICIVSRQDASVVSAIEKALLA